MTPADVSSKTEKELIDMVAALRKEQFELSSARATRSAEFKPHVVRNVRRSLANVLKELQQKHGVVLSAGKRARRRHSAIAHAKAIADAKA
eukprot:CAMPEP_0194265676 /NCGR_PEP_ID=MMETSP0169-20130528/836_1 /TAXON_ID=218684 /ORGANISM="Corethron pennatum, Strain L29A3" /LENGTH=90 /DNA_ID=CAMNT_0039006193 /DNA_START=225 /DNA_END=497 /DNA_ORIENTATION=+